MTDLTIKNGSLDLAASVFGPGDAPDVLCLHGIAGARDTWAETASRLGGRFRVWTLDFRGHGHSDRAEDYLVGDYASDAAAALHFIHKPTIVVSHSLGAVAAAYLAQSPHPWLKAVLLEDPPYYFGEQDEFAKTGNAKAFAAIQERQRVLQKAGASLDEFLKWTGSIPSPLGGLQADHTTERHLLSSASALMRQDPETWTPAQSTAVFERFDGDKPLKVPALLLQADHDLRPGFLKGHETRFLQANPEAKVVYMDGAIHRIHATRESEARFLDEMEAFVAAQAGMAEAP